MKYKGYITKMFAEKNTWVAFRFISDDTGDSYSVSGNTGYPLYDGCEVTIEGSEYFDEKYGPKIKAEKIVPNSKAEMVREFLSKSVAGIGEKLAKEIVDKLGEDAIDKINADPSLLLGIKGIKKKKYEMIVESLSDVKDFTLRMEIYDYFSGKITINQLGKLIDYLEEKHITFDHIKRNPYLLVRKIDGFGFKTVDSFGKAAGIKELDEERVYGAVVYTLRELSYSKGHVFAYEEDLSKDVSALLFPDNNLWSSKLKKTFDAIRKEPYGYLAHIGGLSPEFQRYGKELAEKTIRLSEIIHELLESSSEDIVVDDNRIYWIGLYKAECSIAEFVKNRRSMYVNKLIEDIDEKIECYETSLKVTLSDEQKAAVKTSLQNPFSIITGGPGRGKSTIVDFIIKIWNDNESVLLLAPTGKAAQRLAAITGLPAKTIHKVIMTKEIGEKDRHLIVIDESSMMGVQIFSKLIRGIQKTDTLILIGDINQLASIEPGNVLKDLINSKAVPTSMLVKGFRNAGSIELNADAINKNGSFKDLIWDEDSEFIESQADTLLQDTCNAYEDALKKFDRKDILILSPMKKVGNASVGNINRLLSEVTNKNITKKLAKKAEKEGDFFDSNFVYVNEFKVNGSQKIDFKLNDRVIQVTNNYNRNYIDSDGNHGKGIFNGDMGTIVEMDGYNQTLDVEFDSGLRSMYKFSDLSEIMLAYSITVHKSQGSEAGCIICVVSNQHAFSLKKNLLYTAVTRAKKKLIIIGDKKTITVTCKKEDDSKRNSYLVERITDPKVIEKKISLYNKNDDCVPF